MLPEDEKLLRLAEAATPGPWTVNEGGYEGSGKAGDELYQYESAGIPEAFTIDCGDYFGLSNENAAYIVAACNAFPRALKRIAAFREFLQALLALHGPHIYGICTDCDCAKRMLGEDEAAAKELGK